MEKIRTTKLKLADLTPKAYALRDAVGKILSPIWKALMYSPLETVFPLSVICISVRLGGVDMMHVKRVLAKYSVLSSRPFEHAGEVFPSPDEVAADTAHFMKEAGLKKCDAVLVVPRSWIIFKAIELPVAVKANIDEVINYEFDRFTPLSASEALYDFFTEQKSQDMLGVYLAASRASAVNEYLEKLATKAIAVKRVGFDVSALADYCRFASGLNKAYFAGISPKRCEGGFYEGAILKSASYCEFSADDDYRKAEEIESFISGQKKEEPAGSDTVPVMLAFSEETGGLRSAMASRANVSFKSTAEFEEKIKGGPMNGYIKNVAAGGAIGYLCPNAGGFNLLARGIRAGDKKSFLLTYILAGAILASVALFVFVPMMSERDRLAKIDREIAQRKSEVAAIEKIRAEIAAITKKTELMEGFKSGAPMRIDLIRELTTIIPANAWLTRVRVVENKINIEGYAQSATSLIQLLEASKHFRNVEFATPTFRDAQMNMDRFQIKMEVRESKKEEPAGEKK